MPTTAKMAFRKMTLNVERADGFAGLPAARAPRRLPDEGILKRSSAFLASLAHHPFRGDSPDEGRTIELFDFDLGGASRSTGLKGYFSLNGAESRGVRQSSSVQALSTSWKKSAGVKKSVSFSSDTSFEEKRAPYRKPAVHEVRVYRKGVLQGELKGANGRSHSWSELQ